MPGSSTNVGPGAPGGVRDTPQNGGASGNQAVQSAPVRLFSGQPALASVDHMDMSAPIEPVTPTVPPGEVPHEPDKPPVSLLPVVPPLSDEVAPFKTPEPKIPATEYVPVSVIESIMQPPAPPVKKREPVPSKPAPPVRKSEPVPPKPAAAVKSPANQAIGPIISKRPAATPPQPASPMTGQAPKAAPIRHDEPAIHTAPVPPVATVEPVIVPPVVPIEPAAAPLVPREPVTATIPAVPIAAPQTASIATPEAAPSAPPPGDATGASTPANLPAQADKPLMIYSQNTRDVWHARRSSRILNVVVLVGMVVIFGSILVYWLSIGSPTRVEDLPFISSQK